jgi:hypothetical protein
MAEPSADDEAGGSMQHPPGAAPAQNTPARFNRPVFQEHLASLQPQLAGAVLQGFGDVGGLDFGCAGQVGDSAGELQQPVEGPA